MDVTIDCSAITSRNQLHCAFAESLSFPDWYGNNLDALHDQLTSLCGETHIRLENWSTTEAALGRYAANVKKMLDHAQAQNKDLHITFLS